jgi:bacterioferritin-associated ferredoxin
VAEAETVSQRDKCAVLVASLSDSADRLAKAEAQVNSRQPVAAQCARCSRAPKKYPSD